MSPATIIIIIIIILFALKERAEEVKEELIDEGGDEFHTPEEIENMSDEEILDEYEDRF